MTKPDKIKICREFMRGKELGGIFVNGKFVSPEYFDALRWGLKHPEELRKGK